MPLWVRIELEDHNKAMKNSRKNLGYSNERRVTILVIEFEQSIINSSIYELEYRGAVD